MIVINVTVDQRALRRIVARGHAVRKAGEESAACAAVSVALKGLALSIAERPACRCRFRADAPGEFDLEVVSCDAPTWLDGVWRVVYHLLYEAARAWPDEVQLNFSEEKRYGS